MNKTLKFMVVDDNHTNNLLCKYIIRKYKEDAEIIIFSKPEDALDFIKEDYVSKGENNFTLLFLDINMPFMTGWEFLEVFKNFSEEIHRQFVIFMLTSSVDKRDKGIAEANPFVSGFISKPLSVDTIQQVVEDHCLMNISHKN